MAAEGVVLPLDQERAGDTSMGPRQDGRGRLRFPGRWRCRRSCFNGAAAGWPRKAGTAQEQPPAPLASMGPRPDGRGRYQVLYGQANVPHASMGPRPDGRGRIGGPPPNAPGGLLQWGRGRMAAEGGNDGRRGALTLAASMGPRPDGRGRRYLRVDWGPFIGCFNGAAAGWPRKGRRPHRRAVPASSFNGAAAGWPRKEPMAIHDR